MLSMSPKTIDSFENIPNTQKTFVMPDSIFSSDVIARQRYFVCQDVLFKAQYLMVLNDENYLTVSHSQIHWIENPLLQSHQLMIGYIKIISDVLHIEADSQEIFNQFRQYLLSSWLKWSRSMINEIWKHLKSREGQAHSLTSNTSIQLIIADILIQQEIVESSLSESYLCLPSLQIDHYKNSLRALDKIQVLLAKLYGGRAFLNQSIVEMMAMLAYFKKIYF